MDLAPATGSLAASADESESWADNYSSLLSVLLFAGKQGIVIKILILLIGLVNSAHAIYLIRRIENCVTILV